MLLAMAHAKPLGAWVLTSNVDGQFQKAGFPPERICEIHGSIHHLQCPTNCSDRIWPADDFQPRIDHENCRLLGVPPLCPRCGGLARPNILMFGDWAWNEARTARQHQRLHEWLATTHHLVCIEIGAGTHIPSVRHFSENCGGRLIRINPRETGISRGIGIALGGLEGIGALARELAHSS